MGKKTIIGIMGPGAPSTTVITDQAYQLGKAIAEQGWVVLTGGRSAGIMEAAMKGAKEAKGLTIGVLPSADGNDASEYVDIPIITDMGNARNNINILSSDVVIGIGTGLGTTSEITLAIKSAKPVLLMNQTEEAKLFFRSFNYPALYLIRSPEEAVNKIRSLI